eukprot:COSAG02_NODE_244_length_27402_cov_41.050397_16_plen_105_part_00
MVVTKMLSNDSTGQDIPTGARATRRHIRGSLARRAGPPRGRERRRTDPVRTRCVRPDSRGCSAQVATESTAVLFDTETALLQPGGHLGGLGGSAGGAGGSVEGA